MIDFKIFNSVSGTMNKIEHRSEQQHCRLILAPGTTGGSNSQFPVGAEEGPSMPSYDVTHVYSWHV